MRTVVTTLVLLVDQIEVLEQLQGLPYHQQLTFRIKITIFLISTFCVTGWIPFKFVKTSLCLGVLPI
jgi:hypothetical protein